MFEWLSLEERVVVIGAVSSRTFSRAFLLVISGRCRLWEMVDTAIAMMLFEMRFARTGRGF